MSRALDRKTAPNHAFSADAGPRGDEGEPELNLTLSGIAAHCDPSFCGDWDGAKYRVSSPEMHMSNRAAKFVTAIFASLLAGAPLTTVSYGAADDCLSGPKDETPEGSHWYYRIDRATKRHCWYLREQIAAPLQITAPISPPSAKPASPKAEATPQRSIADARAELPPQTRVEKQENLFTGQQTTAAAPYAAGALNNPRPSAVDANMLSSVIASRWPGQSGANPPTNPAPDADNPAPRANSTSRTQPPSVLAAGQYAAADLSSQTSTHAVPVRLVGLMGALALAGIALASVIRKPGGRRRHRQAKLRVRRDTIWEPTDDDRIVLSAPPGADILPRRTGFACDRAGDRDDRIAEFFSQLSRRAPT
jgi:hypothetical protein